jgi:hypothetical protein
MPPLIKIVGGWVPTLHPLPIPYDRKDLWATQHEWPISIDMVGRMSREQVQQVFFRSRLPLIVFPLLTTALIWWWARQLFSPVTGLVLALVYAVSPSTLGHGCLFKNDIAATFAYLLFGYCVWRWWRDPRLSNAALLGAAVLLALLAKLSMLIVLLAVVGVVVWRRRSVAAIALAIGIPYAGTLVAYQFEAATLGAADLEPYRQMGGVPAAFLAVSNVFRVLPVATAMWHGTASLLQSNSDSVAYLLGQTYPGGHRLYFLVALAVKVPLATQILMLSGITLIAWGRRTYLWLLLAPGIYIAMASFSSLQLGYRLILPAYPYMLLAAGASVEWLRHGRRAVVLAALLGWLMARSGAIYPHGISFFNDAAGGPEQGLRYLADSNLDWGQDLPELADFITKNKIEHFHLSYFGTDNPWRYFTDRQMTLMPPPWSEDLVEGTALQPKTGYWAISATLLPGHFFNAKYRHYFEAFRKMERIGMAGYSIYIYRVP